MTSPHQQKLRIMGPVIVTANRLTDGVVVHRAAGGNWVAGFSEAEVLTTAEAAQAALTSAQGDGLHAVGPYIAPIKRDQADMEPGNLREQIRERGPTFALPIDQPARQRLD